MQLEIDDDPVGRRLDLLLTDPQIIFQSQRGNAISDYDAFTESDMRDAIAFLAACLKEGGHGHILCNQNQFP